MFKIKNLFPKKLKRKSRSEPNLVTFAANGPNVDFEVVLDNPRSFLLFKQHVYKELNRESIDFIVDVQAFQKVVAAKNVTQAMLKAKLMYEMYVRPNSIKEINVGSPLRKQIKKTLSQVLPESFKINSPESTCTPPSSPPASSTTMIMTISAAAHVSSEPVVDLFATTTTSSSCPPSSSSIASPCAPSASFRQSLRVIQILDALETVFEPAYHHIMLNLKEHSFRRFLASEAWKKFVMQEGVGAAEDLKKVARKNRLSCIFKVPKADFLFGNSLKCNPSNESAL